MCSSSRLGRRNFGATCSRDFFQGFCDQAIYQGAPSTPSPPDRLHFSSLLVDLGLSIANRTVMGTAESRPVLVGPGLGMSASRMPLRMTVPRCPAPARR